MSGAFQDDEHRFELATQLGKLQMAADIIVSISAQANECHKQLRAMATHALHASSLIRCCYLAAYCEDDVALFEMF